MVSEFGRYTIEGLGGERVVRVHLPRGQTAFTHPVPVLVLFDGQNVFDDGPSFAGGWHTHVAVDRLSPKRHHVPIVVGVDHGGEARIDELGPFVMNARGGKADTMIDWVSNVLLPEVRRRYPIMEGPLGVCVGGSSMGGLAAFYAHFRRPDVFGGALVMSPSFWFGARELTTFIERRKRPYFSRVYLDCGLREGGGRMAPLVERFAKQLTGRGYDDRALRLRIDKRGTHSERDWRRRLPAALRFMYAR
jgi:enterochelin esterase-like enzyme